MNREQINNIRIIYSVSTLIKMASAAARKRSLEQMQQSPFAREVEQSYPASPPLGFPTPRVSKGIVKEVFVWNQDGSEYSTSSVLETAGSDVAYELPGGLIHLAACGEIRLCHVIKKESSTMTSYPYRRTVQTVAIKMGQRSTMRHLHNDEERWDHQHHPFPENPWKEISALQLIHADTEQLPEENNIIPLIEALYDDDYLYEILPHYPKSLYWLIHREHAETGLEEALARHYFTQLLNAIHNMHSRGICHRDISSHNLVVDDAHDNKLVLIDFGMCLRVPYNYPDDHYTEDVTEANRSTSRRMIHCQSHCGKLRFMAPEMYAQQDFDGLAVDLWSAAVVLFEMITGKLPYQKPCESDAGYHDLMDERFYWDPKVVDPSLSWGHPVSPELVDLLHGMFRPSPKDRLSLAQVAAHPWLNENNM
jgi:serine/threonine protein kinase